MVHGFGLMAMANAAAGGGAEGSQSGDGSDGGNSGGGLEDTLDFMDELEELAEKLQRVSKILLKCVSPWLAAPGAHTDASLSLRAQLLPGAGRSDAASYSARRACA